MPMWYLAGPFFNPSQMDLIKSIEESFIDSGVPMFSPRLCDENKKKGPLTAQDARVIFARNVDNILNCGCMLAVLDWKMPSNQYIAQVERGLKPSENYGRPTPDLIKNFPLNLPDTGTVFEMGAMYMQWLLLHQMAKSSFPENGGKPRLVGFTERGEKDKLNIMLTQACCGIIHGLDELKQFLNKGDIQWHLAKPWTGANL